MEPDYAVAAYALVQPFTESLDRLETVIVVFEHARAMEAFAELERIAERLHPIQHPW